MTPKLYRLYLILRLPLLPQFLHTYYCDDSVTMGVFRLVGKKDERYLDACG